MSSSDPDVARRGLMCECGSMSVILQSSSYKSRANRSTIMVTSGRSDHSVAFRSAKERPFAERKATLASDFNPFLTIVVVKTNPTGKVCDACGGDTVDIWGHAKCIFSYLVRSSDAILRAFRLPRHQ